MLTNAKGPWIGLLLLAAGLTAACGKKPSTAPATNASAAPAQPTPEPTAGPESEARRHSIPGGQVILSDDAAFKTAVGWSYVEFDAGGKPSRWTTAETASVEWRGPETPGEYTVHVSIWRFQPFPQKEVKAEFRLSGDPEWKSQAAGLQRTVLEGKVKTAQPGETLRLELKIPTWVPKDSIPGESDPRTLGAMLEAIEVVPAGAVGVTAPADSVPVATGEQTKFDVLLLNGGQEKIKVIKELRTIVTDLGLKEAKDLFESAPATVLKGVGRAEAEKAKQALEAVGATVEIK